MCYPWSNHNAISVLQRRTPGKKEKEKKAKNKNKTIESHGKPLFLSEQIFFLKKKFSLLRPPPDKKKHNKTKTSTKKEKEYKTKH